MKQYTLFVITAACMSLYLDRLVGTNLVHKKIFWQFHGIVIVLTTVVDSISSGLPIVIFSADAILNIRFFHIPLENYVFGFSLLTFNLILFELFVRRNNEN